MSETKHTPGPWLVFDSTESTGEDDPPCIYVDLPEGHAGPDAVSILVNADWATDEDLRLMAASPTMYEALKGLVEDYGTMYHADPAVLTAARAAIRAAEGGTE